MTVIDELIAILGYKFEGEKDVARFKQGIDGAEKRLRGFASAVTVIGAAITTGIGAMFARSVIQVGSQFENLQVRLEALEGSSDKAKKAMDWVTVFAQKTPLSLKETADAYAMLKTFGIDPMNGSLQAAVDTMAKNGGSADYLQGVILGLGQAWTKEKLQGEEALQLIERGIPVWELLSEATGKSAAELQNLSQKGKLGRKEIALLIEMMEKKSFGASEKMSKTWSGVTGRLGDTWTMFLKRIADAGFFDTAKRQVDRFSDFLTELAADGRLERWARTLSEALSAAADAISPIAKGIVKDVGTIIDAFKKMPELKWAMLALGVFMFPTVAAFGLLALLADDVLTMMRGGKSIIGDFSKWLQDLTGVAKSTADAISLIGAAILAAFIFKPGLAKLGLRAAGGLIGVAGGVLGGILGAGAGTAAPAVAAPAAAAPAAAEAGFLALAGRGLVRFLAPIGVALGVAELLKTFDPKGNLWGMTSGIDEWMKKNTGFDPSNVTPDGSQRGTFGQRLDGAPNKADRFRVPAAVPGGGRDYTLGAFGGFRPPEQAPMAGGFKGGEVWVDRMNAALAKLPAAFEMLGKMSGAMPGSMAPQVVNDNRQDNRSTTVNITQNIAQVSDAPRAAAEATGRAVTGASTSPLRTPGRIAAEPATSWGGPR